MMRLGLALAATLLLCLCACSGDKSPIDSVCRTAYIQGYRQGASDAAKAVELKAESARKSLLKKLKPRLMAGVLAASLLTLFGDKLLETARSRISKAFKLTPRQQAKLAILLFWSIATTSIAVLCGRHGLAPLAPAAILLGSAAWSLHSSYLPALLTSDTPARHLALSKLKTLLFLVLVIAMVFELLSPESPIAFKP